MAALGQLNVVVENRHGGIVDARRQVSAQLHFWRAGRGRESKPAGIKARIARSRVREYLSRAAIRSVREWAIIIHGNQWWAAMHCVSCLRAEGNPLDLICDLFSGFDGQNFFVPVREGLDVDIQALEILLIAAPQDIDLHFQAALPGAANPDDFGLDHIALFIFGERPGKHNGCGRIRLLDRDFLLRRSPGRTFGWFSSRVRSSAYR